MTRKIQVNRVARVEGYGGIQVEIADGRVKDVKMNILEGARFLEGLVGGRRFDEVPDIICRICAICSAVHKLTAIQAMEDALGVQVSERTALLRELLVQGGNIESHALHIYCLALPDFAGVASVIELNSTHPDTVAEGLRIKKLGNQIQETVGGRAIHPENAVIGGFGRLPVADDIKRLRDGMAQGLDDVQALLPFVRGLEMPDYREGSSVYVALRNGDKDFSFYGDRIVCSDGAEYPLSGYKELTNEFVVPHSNAKHSRHNGKPFVVGALARLTLNGDRLGGAARRAIDALGLVLPTTNILYNNHAQVVELVWALERGRDICERLLEMGLEQEKPVEVKARAGVGTGAIEAPRGTLYHQYELDEEGRVVKADVVTPTAQNLSAFEHDMRAMVESNQGDDDATLRLKVEMVVRAYDPCISCSVH